jgi:hypothetical protein
MTEPPMADFDPEDAYDADDGLDERLEVLDAMLGNLRSEQARPDHSTPRLVSRSGGALGIISRMRLLRDAPLDELDDLTNEFVIIRQGEDW